MTSSSNIKDVKLKQTEAQFVTAESTQSLVLPDASSVAGCFFFNGGALREASGSICFWLAGLFHSADLHPGETPSCR